MDEEGDRGKQGGEQEGGGQGVRTGTGEGVSARLWTPRRQSRRFYAGLRKGSIDSIGVYSSIGDYASTG